MSSQASLAQALTPKVQQQATQNQLGPLSAMYKPSFTHPIAIISGGLIIIIGGIILGTIFHSIVFFTLFFSILAVIHVIVDFYNRNLCIYHFDQGLIRTKGNQIEVVRWEHVRAIFVEIRRKEHRTNYLYTIECDDGARIMLTDVVERIETLGQNVQQSILNALWPSVVASYQAGNSLSFGPLSVSMQGIAQGIEVLPWNQVQDVKQVQDIIKRDYIDVKSVGKTSNWSHTLVSRIPNVIIFLRLCDYACTGR